MKADKNFKLAKPVKRMLSTILDKGERKVFKDAMITAQVEYEANKKKAPRGAKETKDE